jgi:hypothetical protein
MLNKILFSARAQAKEKGLNQDLVEKLVLHYSNGLPEAPRGVMGVKSGRGNKRTAWTYDLKEGIELLEDLVSAFEGDELKAAAAHLYSEAIVRQAGDEWRSLLPEGIA